jgi:hypothetical protein
MHKDTREVLLEYMRRINQVWNTSDTPRIDDLIEQLETPPCSPQSQPTPQSSKPSTRSTPPSSGSDSQSSSQSSQAESTPNAATDSLADRVAKLERAIKYESQPMNLTLSQKQTYAESIIRHIIRSILPLAFDAHLPDVATRLRALPKTATIAECEYQVQAATDAVNATDAAQAAYATDAARAATDSAYTAKDAAHAAAHAAEHGTYAAHEAYAANATAAIRVAAHEAARTADAVKVAAHTAALAAEVQREYAECVRDAASEAGITVGIELEEAFGSAMAGAILYALSGHDVPDFYTNNDTAMADIIECAKGGEA